MKSNWAQPTNWTGSGGQYTEWVTTDNSICCDGWYTGNGESQNPLNVFSDVSGWHSKTNSLPHWIGWYTVVPIEVHQFEISTFAVAGYVPTEYQLEASTDGINWVLLASYTKSSSEALNVVNVVPESSYGAYHYHRIVITKTGGNNYTFVGGLKITAVQIIHNGSISDTMGWNQPIIESNKQYGEITCSTFKIGNEPWKAVDSISNIGWVTNDRSEGWWMWKLPQSITIKSLIFTSNKTDSTDYDYTFCYGQFFTNNTRQVPLGKSFKVESSEQLVNIDVDDVETDTIYFYKVGGRFTGIGQLTINASYTGKTGRWTDVSACTMIYGEGKPSVQAYVCPDKLVWYDKNYKHYYRDWPLPQLQDDFSYGVLNSSTRTALSLPYKALDGNEPINDSSLGYNSFLSSQPAPQWWMWDLPHPIILRQLEFKNNYSPNGSSRSKKLQFFADEEMTIPIGNEFVCENTDGGIYTLIPERPIKVNKIFCLIKEGYSIVGVVGIGEIRIIGRYRGEEVDINTSLSRIELPPITENGRFEDEEQIVTTEGWMEWQQPIMTSNTTYGELTCDSTNSNNYLYHAFDNTTGTKWLNTNNTTGWIQWKLPEKIKVKSFSVSGTDVGTEIPSTIEFQVSTDGVTWQTVVTKTDMGASGWDTVTKVDVNLDVEYDYIRWNFPNGNLGSTSGIGIGEIKLEATVYKIITETIILPASELAVRVSSNTEQTDAWKLFDGNENDLGWESTESTWIPEDYIEYEEELIDWVQPIFTSSEVTTDDGTYTISASSEVATHEGFNVMNNAEGSFWETSQATISNDTPAFLIFETPIEIKPTSITISNVGNMEGNLRNAKILATLDDGITWQILGTIDNAPNIGGHINTVNITSPKFYKKFKIIITESHVFDKLLIQDIQITAQILHVKEIPIISQCPYLIMHTPKKILFNGITFFNNLTGIKKFQVYGSHDNITYIDLGVYYSPGFSQNENAIYNVPINNVNQSFNWFKIRIWETWNADNKVRLNQIKLNTFELSGVWVDWIQPTLYSDDYYGEVTASTYNSAARSPYLALDGTIPSNAERAWVSFQNSASPQWWMWKLPYKIQLSSIIVYNTGVTTDVTEQIQFYSDEGITPLTDLVTLDTNKQVANTIPIDNVEVDTLYAKCYSSLTNGTYIGIGEIKLEAKRYYLYNQSRKVWREWVQPVFSSNTTWGEVSCSSSYSQSPPYKALNPTWTYNDSGEWQTNNQTTGWWKWVFKQPLRVQRIRYYQQHSVSYFATSVTIYEDSTMQKIIVPTFTPPAPTSANNSFIQYNYIDIDIDLQVLNGLYIVVNGTGYVGIGNLLLTAEYEYEPIQDGNWVEWTQPIFGSNTTWGTLTASDESHPAYKALDGTYGGSSDYSNTWECGATTTGWWKWVFPQTLKIQNIRIYQRAYSSTYHTDRVSVYEDETKSISLAVNANMPQMVNGFVDIDGQDLELNSLYIEVSGSNYVGIGEIEVTALYIPQG